MKLLWHEFAVEARRRWPFALLFVVVVLLDFSFVMEWQAPEVVIDGDTGERVVRRSLGGLQGEAESLNNTLLQIILWSSAVVAAASSSPMRPGATVRIRPVAAWQRFGARALWVVVFFGIPWWIHEFAFVLASGLSIEVAVLAAVQRAILTVYWWLGAATLGRVTGSVWKSGLAAVIGLIVTQWSEVAISIGINLDFGIEPPDFGLVSRGRIAEMLVFAVPLIGLWIGFGWMRYGANRRWQLWAPYLAGCLAYPVLSVQAAHLAQQVLLRGATDVSAVKAISDSFTIEANTADPMDSIDPDDFEWRVKPLIEGLSGEFLATPLFADGIQEFESTGEIVHFKPVREHFDNFTFYAYEAELRRLLDLAGNESRVFVSGIPVPVLRMVPRDRNPETEALIIDRKAKRTGRVNARFDLHRLGDLETIPLDGSRREFGVDGKIWVDAMFRERGAWTIEVRHQQSESLVGGKAIRIPRRLWALRFPGKDWLIVIPGGDAYARVAPGSAAPIRYQTLRFQPDSFPSSIDLGNRDFLQGAELVMFEAAYLGEVRKEFEVSEIPIRGNSVNLTNSYVNDRRFPESEIEKKLSAFRELPEELSEREAREFFYGLGQLSHSSIQPAEKKPTPTGIRAYHNGIPVDIKGLVARVPEVHRPLAREAAIEFPELATAFPDGFWRDSDRGWVMRNLSRNRQFQRLAARKGWLAEDPEAVGEAIRDRFWITQELIDAGIDAGIDEAKHWETKRFYSMLQQAPDKRPRRFPEFEAEVRDEFEAGWRERWERDRWKLRFPLQAPFTTAGVLGRLGDEALLREALTEFLSPGNEVAQKHQMFRQLDPWPVFQSAFGEEKGMLDLERIRHWLDSDWEYDPETLTWRLKSR